jgi:hypothetical protein
MLLIAVLSNLRNMDKAVKEGRATHKSRKMQSRTTNQLAFGLP